MVCMTVNSRFRLLLTGLAHARLLGREARYVGDVAR